MRKYIKIKENILGEIRTGILKPGNRLPVREELIKKYEVTRSTLNKALGELIKENWLIARRNAGTFVATGPSRFRTALVFSGKPDAPFNPGRYHNKALDYAIVSELKNNFSVIQLRDAEKDLSFIADYDAVIWPAPSDETLEKLKPFGHKVIVINRYADNLNFVSTDHRQGQMDITEKFINRYGDNISLFYLETTRYDFVWRERREGFMDACEKHGKFYKFLRLTSDFAENVKILMDITFRNDKDNVIVSPSSITTGAVLRMAYEKNLRIGKDFFYSDFDDINSLYRTGIEIPSVLQNYEKMGKEVSNSLEKLKKGFVRKFIPHKLINI